MIVNQAPDRDVNSDLYDYDLPEHVVFIQDWFHEPAISRVAAFPPRTSESDTMIINGKGMFTEFTKDGKVAYTPREVFSVKKDDKYRFRVISNGVCHMTIAVENHNLTVIATDGAPVQPTVVDRIGLSSGERFDFVLNADKDVDNYWFRLSTADGACANTVPEEFAILRYDGAPEQEPSRVFSEGEDDGVTLNPRNQLLSEDDLDIGQLEAAGKGK